MFDLSKDINEERGIDKKNVKSISVSGYGNPDILRQMINMEQPDAIMIYTDPRFWIWLYHMEHEIRQNIPIFYYNIWDDLPYPQYNQNYYESCDLIMNISKQTHNIVERFVKENQEQIGILLMFHTELIQKHFILFHHYTRNTKK